MEDGSSTHAFLSISYLSSSKAIPHASSAFFKAYESFSVPVLSFSDSTIFKLVNFEEKSWSPAELELPLAPTVPLPSGEVYPPLLTT